jgi:hypothetical protein
MSRKLLSHCCFWRRWLLDSPLSARILPRLKCRPHRPRRPNPSPRPHLKDEAPAAILASGSGDIGKGAGEGAGNAAEGVGKGAGDLVTLHPVGAAENVGKGAGAAGKDAGKGAVKGTGKIAKGTGKLIAKPFHHPKKNGSPDEHAN